MGQTLVRVLLPALRALAGFVSLFCIAGMFQTFQTLLVGHSPFVHGEINLMPWFWTVPGAVAGIGAGFSIWGWRGQGQIVMLGHWGIAACFTLGWISVVTDARTYPYASVGSRSTAALETVVLAVVVIAAIRNALATPNRPWQQMFRFCLGLVLALLTNIAADWGVGAYLYIWTGGPNFAFIYAIFLVPLMLICAGLAIGLGYLSWRLLFGMRGEIGKFGGSRPSPWRTMLRLAERLLCL